jgi:hypothetical protein
MFQYLQPFASTVQGFRVSLYCSQNSNVFAIQAYWLVLIDTVSSCDFCTEFLHSIRDFCVIYCYCLYYYFISNPLEVPHRGFSNKRH